MVQGLVPDGETLSVEWWKRQGRVYMDGPRLSHQVRMGEIVRLSADAPPLELYDSSWAGSSGQGPGE
jgi:hypothetical protein